MTGWYRRSPFTVEDHAAADAQSSPEAIYRIVSESYFETAGIPLWQGRLFDVHDLPDSPPVALINREMARRHWPGEDPLGKRVKWGESRSDSPWMTVVGTVGDVCEDGLDKPPQPTVYMPLKQDPLSVFFLAIRTESDPASVMPAVRRALKEVHPKIPVYRLRRLDDIVLDSTWQLRYSMLLLGGLAAISLLLAVIGVYGVLSYAVTDRTQEIGVRMALGATRPVVMRLVVRRGLRLVAMGVSIGLAAACALTRFLSALLFGISPLDPLTFALVALVLIASGVLACYVPALRASRVEPMTALRYE
jgi:putative ABC transport system permease protein